MRLFEFAALCDAFALCVLCCDCWLCFSLCERILDCCLRSFALARATSPCQSPRAGPQRFLVLVRVYGAVRFIVLYYPYNISVYLHPQKKTQHCAKVSDFPADITYRMFDGITMPAQQICKSYGGEFYGDQKTVSCSERLPRKFV